MTDQTTTTQTATPAATDTAAPAANQPADTSATKQDSPAPAQQPAATPKEKMSSSYDKKDDKKPAAKADDKAADDDGKKDSSETDSAQEQPTDETDDAKPADQSSDDQDAEDTDKKDAEDEDKEGEGNQEAQPAYEPFTMPEGMELDEDALSEATPLLQELGADQEQAQKLVDVAASMLSKAVKKMTDQHNATVEGWRQQSMELFGKEGDAKFQEKVGRAEEVVKHFFSEDQRSVLTHYGLGNHPAFFAMALAIAEQTGEDRPTLPGAGGQKGQKTLGQIWYPET